MLDVPSYFLAYRFEGHENRGDAEVVSRHSMLSKSFAVNAQLPYHMVDTIEGNGQ